MNSRRARSRFHTEPISCDPGPTVEAVGTPTDFEKRRGVSRLEIRSDYSQVLVSGLEQDELCPRVNALKVLAEANIGISLLKITQDGFTFLVTADQSDGARRVLAESGYALDVVHGRSIVLVHAVNMRDEEGLIASVVASAIASGAPIDHLADMHDRMLIATSVEGAPLIVQSIRTKFPEVRA